MNFKKSKSGFTLLQSLVGIAILALLAMFTMSAQADTYQTGQLNFYRDDTNAFPLTLTNGQAALFTPNTTSSLELPLRQDHGLSVFVTVISSNSAGGTGKVGWDVTGDGTAYTTSQPLLFSFPTANYSNNVLQASGVLTTNVYWTNWPATVVNNVRDVQATFATNALVGGGPTTNTVIYRLRYSYSVNP